MRKFIDEAFEQVEERKKVPEQANQRRKKLFNFSWQQIIKFE